ncbi:hypothetical protein B296_00010335 [Ensete ventricosum]|uniref:Uncharacterized protein n=1 Tax=Ensete ventricosum TaxID=4639 RepID=A0A426ZL25_ENSVE|nr:hypothetical protein B296_00010335 [Ensete ventricosum]
MGRVAYEYGYRVTLARFRSLHPDSEVEEDPFTIRPEDDSVPMERQQAFDDSNPPEKAIARLYDRRVRPRFIKTGNLVLQKAEVSDPTRSHGKLAPNWKEPYRVVDVVREGTYTLATAEGRVLSRM